MLSFERQSCVRSLGEEDQEDENEEEEEEEETSAMEKKIFRRFPASLKLYRVYL